ncbi:o-methyltransferase [Colletotrichum musicola]|uniref:O-methyltransferase n=1 Tax=Colletotrichum musicola TaxID=2175873 RepID=A0A8H6NR56_9PEZI|nr:o-methyltransferase [Colletotrichum musicola]
MTSEQNGIAGGEPAEGGTTLTSFLENVKNIDAASFQNEGERMQALLAAQALLARLESPWDTAVRLNMTQPALGAAIKTALDLKLFEAWLAQGNGALTSEQAAELIGGKCDSALLYRLLRLMAANHLVEEVGVGRFKPTQFGIALTAPVFHGLFNTYYDLILPTYVSLPSFLASTNYANPQDPRRTAFQHAHAWEGDLWSYYRAHPEKQDEFNKVQESIALQQPSWTEIYPAGELVKGCDESGPLLVDVGGGTGHDVRRFCEVVPELRERVWLEDVQEVVGIADVPGDVGRVGYDFFTPQPIQGMSFRSFPILERGVADLGVEGARAYLMHSVLHDWPDEQARRILEMQKGAMTPGYSRLLIHDHVDVLGPAKPQAAAFDIQMMALVAGRERSEEDWRSLLGSVGMRFLGVWEREGAAHCVIEVEVPP